MATPRQKSGAPVPPLARALTGQRSAVICAPVNRLQDILFEAAVQEQLCPGSRT
ncbi:MAG: hypothetical protein JHD07_08825 [Bradyrhizobium sp.]|uniref:hypothetical protein n=1 Tax=Bradyrhizobium sp. TaxID=376 RepID=UPI001A21D1F4|nr:hypothetical protein [Bradyrhizobium sp.]MBJ7403381.1 hypothetical protein [Bradyrhizobium sp.]